MQKHRACKKRLAMLNAASSLGMKILGISALDGRDYVHWHWKNEKTVHKSAVKTVKGQACFRVNRVWISLADCMKKEVNKSKIF